MKAHPLINVIYDKRLEIHYNEMTIRAKDGKPIKLNLQGKIKCPLLNMGIASIVCSKIMDKADWPRGLDKNICEACECYIHVSIKKFQENKNGPRERDSK